MEQIDKDVDRTHPSIPFFSAGAGSEEGAVASGTNAYHFNDMKLAMRRMLFIYAKLNPGLKYVQVRLDRIPYARTHTHTCLCLYAASICIFH